MSNVSVIVDDQDFQIHYTGLWTLAGSDINFSRTAYSSSVAGASMTFLFNGTYVAVVGDFDAGGSCTSTFSIDGSQSTFISPTLNASQHQLIIWSSPTLNDGQHTLVYTTSSCSNSGGSNGAGLYVWVDYLLYSPSPGTSPPGAKYFIDDSSPQLVYSGNWTSNGEDGDFGHTKHGGASGSTMQFTFNGTFVSVNGRVNAGGTTNTKASFVVDGSDPVVFSSAAQNVVSYNNEFFKVTNLPSGSHTLSVTSDSDNPLWIDYLLVQRASPTATSPPVTAPNASHSFPMAAIAGIAVGVVVLVVVVLVVLFLRRRKTQKSPLHQVQMNQGRPLLTNDNASTTLTYYSYPPSQSPVSSPGHSVMAFSTHSQSRYGRPPHRHQPSIDETISSSNASPSVHQRPLPQPGSQTPRRARSRTETSAISEGSIASSSTRMRSATVDHASSDGYADTSTRKKRPPLPVPTDVLSQVSESSSRRARTVERNGSDEHGDTSSRRRREQRQQSWAESPHDVSSHTGTSPSHEQSDVHTDSGRRFDWNQSMYYEKHPSEPPPMYTPG